MFEIGITLAAALIWRQVAKSSARGVVVGVGAGGFEAVLLGLLPVIGALAAYAIGGQAYDRFQAGVNAVALTTPALWLVGPVERVIAILCHTSSRALVLLGVARGRWFWPFAAGFFVMTAIDAAAG